MPSVTPCLDPTALAPLVALAFVLGTLVGSFVCCWAWRLVNGESVARGRSHCTSCGHVLAPRDLVPVVSWLAARGRCRYCGERVSVRYPLSELALGTTFAALVAVFGPTPEAAERAALSAALLLCALTDLDAYLIPNGCVACCCCVRVCYLAWLWASGAPEAAAMTRSSLVGLVALGAGSLALALLGDRVLGRESMGGGDVKLLGAAGLCFGWAQGLLLVVVACACGLALARATGAGREGRAVPFGPAIAVACVATMFVGPAFEGWYLALLA